jgi:hypothetical protein
MYSDVVVQVSFMLRQLNSLPLRQTQEFMSSLIRLMEFTLRQVDLSEILKRSDRLTFEYLVDSSKLEYVNFYKAVLKCMDRISSIKKIHDKA